MLDFLTRELTVSRLNRIHNYLWLAGRAGNIRSLHRQKILERDIVIAEKTDLHLVWDGSRIFIKPLPKFLLDHGFFKEHLCSRSTSSDEESSLYGNACGFLLSYTWLIRHESDFLIAKELNLIPPTMDSWDDWCVFAAEVRLNVLRDNCRMNKRYLYGELRMTRLNLIYRIVLRDFRGFHYGYTRYVFFFQRNFGWLLLVFAYAAVVLAAMQTVLNTSFATATESMRRASYAFGVFSFVTVMTVLGVLVLIFLLFVVIFLSNFVATLRHDRQQSKLKEVSPV